MRRILVDLAGRAAAPDALALATAICAGTGAELVFDLPRALPVDLIVSQTLPPEAPAALALAPPGLAAGAVSLQRIAVGHEGSRESAQALALGERLAARLGATLTIVAVAVEEGEEERLQRHLDRALAGVPSGVEAEAQLLPGDPGAVLTRAGAAADLLVLGSRSHFGRTPRMRPGTVGAAVAAASPKPVLIAPA